MKLGQASNPFPLVLVEWEDSARPDAEWRHLEDIALGEAIQCKSVGFLVSDSKKTKALAPNIAEIGTPDAQASGIIRIPTRCIKRMTRLRGLRFLDFRRFGRCVSAEAATLFTLGLERADRRILLASVPTRLEVVSPFLLGIGVSLNADSPLRQHGITTCPHQLL
jgi:hypothetical protein